MDMTTNLLGSKVEMNYLPLQSFKSVKYTEGIDREEEAVSPFPIPTIYGPISETENITPFHMIK